MAYTVEHVYKKILEGTDKMGSDFYTLPYVMNRIETATYDFIGETVKFIENTQEIRDDIRTLYKPFKIAVVEDPNDSSYQSIALPTDYLHLMSAKVIDQDVQVRDTRVIRHGQEEIFQSDPDTRATAKYPTIVSYDDIFRIITTGNAIFVEGFYVKKPTFGTNDVNNGDIENEISVNLPDNSTDKIIKTVINDIFGSTGDPRFQVQLQIKESYRKR